MTSRQIASQDISGAIQNALVFTPPTAKFVIAGVNELDYSVTNPGAWTIPTSTWFQSGNIAWGLDEPGANNFFILNSNFPHQPCSVFVYNYFDPTTHAFEYATIDWQNTPNVLSFGTKAGLGGTVRPFQFIYGGTNVLDYSVSFPGTWTNPATIGSNNKVGFLQSSVGINIGQLLSFCGGAAGFASVLNPDLGNTNDVWVGYGSPTPLNAPTAGFFRTRAANSDPTTAVHPGDVLGGVFASGADGTNYQSNCGISFTADPAWPVTLGKSIPGLISFQITDPNGVYKTQFSFNSVGTFLQSSIGIDSTVTMYSGDPGIASVVDSTNDTNGVFVAYNATVPAFGCGVFLYRTRAATSAATTSLIAGDNIANIAVLGADGAHYIFSSGINFDVDPAGTVAATKIPGRITFQTSDNTGAAPDRLIIDRNGVVTLPTDIVSAVPGVAIISSVAISPNVTAFNSTNSLLTATDTSAGGTVASMVAYGNAVAGNEIAFFRTRSIGSTSAAGAVQPGDEIFSLYGICADGTQYNINTLSGSINLLVDPLGTVGSAHVPGQLTFNTSAGLLPGDSPRLSIDSKGNVTMGLAALATNATDGFFYADSCAGAPTGVPTSYTGRVPIVIDTSTGTGKLWARIGGTWRGVALS